MKFKNTITYLLALILIICMTSTLLISCGKNEETSSASDEASSEGENKVYPKAIIVSEGTHSPNPPFKITKSDSIKAFVDALSSFNYTYKENFDITKDYKGFKHSYCKIKLVYDESTITLKFTADLAFVEYEGKAYLVDGFTKEIRDSLYIAPKDTNLTSEEAE